MVGRQRYSIAKIMKEVREKKSERERERESLFLSIQKAYFCAGMRVSELIQNILWANKFLNRRGVVCLCRDDCKFS